MLFENVVTVLIKLKAALSTVVDNDLAFRSFSLVWCEFKSLTFARKW